MIARCINDQSEEQPNYLSKSTSNKLSGLTKDKLYEAEQSKEYEGYFDVINDLGIKESYKKERFEIMECINKECGFNIDNVCHHNVISNTCVECDKRIKPQHTPSYAEEQLEHVKEKNKNFLKLLQSDIDNLIKDNKMLENTRDSLIKTNNQLKEENEKLSKANVDLQEYNLKYFNDAKELKRENENLIKEKELLERQLENELSRNHVVMGKNEELKAENKRLMELPIKNEENNKELTVIMAEQYQEINQLREEIQQSEFEIKKYEASEIGYKKIITGLTEALKELTKNVYVEGLED